MSPRDGTHPRGRTPTSGARRFGPVVLVGLVVGSVVHAAALPEAGLAEFVNTRTVRLPFEGEDVGPSGTGSVSLYVTRDGLKRDVETPCRVVITESRGTIVFTAKEDGRHGFAIVVKNRAGQSGQSPPGPGDAGLGVQVDTAAPEAALYPGLTHVETPRNPATS